MRHQICCHYFLGLNAVLVHGHKCITSDNHVFETPVKKKLRLWGMRIAQKARLETCAEIWLKLCEIHIFWKKIHHTPEIALQYISILPITNKPVRVLLAVEPGMGVHWASDCITWLCPTWFCDATHSGCCISEFWVCSWCCGTCCCCRRCWTCWSRICLCVRPDLS